MALVRCFQLALSLRSISLDREGKWLFYVSFFFQSLCFLFFCNIYAHIAMWLNRNFTGHGRCLMSVNCLFIRYNSNEINITWSSAICKRKTKEYTWCHERCLNNYAFPSSDLSVMYLKLRAVFFYFFGHQSLGLHSIRWRF